MMSSVDRDAVEQSIHRELCRSYEVHGDWSNLSLVQMLNVIVDELLEVEVALDVMDLHGDMAFITSWHRLRPAALVKPVVPEPPAAAADKVPIRQTLDRMKSGVDAVVFQALDDAWWSRREALMKEFSGMKPSAAICRAARLIDSIQLIGF